MKKDKETETASEVIGQFRVTPTEKALLEKAAKREQRTVVGFVRFHGIETARKIAVNWQDWQGAKP